MINLFRKNVLFIVSMALVCVLSACGQQAAAPVENTNTPTPEQQTAVKQTELTISAAASLTDALKEIQSSYETAHPDVKLNFNFGASGALQQQIEQGAPADLFISAAVKNMKALADKQLVDKEADLLKNELVVVVPADTGVKVNNLNDLTQADIKNIAIGIPKSVPAGSYAEEALTHAKLWDTLQSKMVQAKDVRQVLQYVATGNADAGFVYRTDALSSKDVKIAFAADADSYSPIVYPAAVVKATSHPQEAEAFYSYLQTEESLSVFRKYGFSVPQ